MIFRRKKSFEKLESFPSTKTRIQISPSSTSHRTNFPLRESIKRGIQPKLQVYKNGRFAYMRIIICAHNNMVFTWNNEYRLLSYFHGYLLTYTLSEMSLLSLYIFLLHLNAFE